MGLPEKCPSRQTRRLVRKFELNDGFFHCDGLFRDLNLAVVGYIEPNGPLDSSFSKTKNVHGGQSKYELYNAKYLKFLRRPYQC